MECGGCGSACRERARFCDSCGERLPAESSQRVAGEISDQRHVTVVFCDLVDSTALARGMDLEPWRDLVRDFQSICFREVTRAGGFVAQYLGDGVLAYFGYPVAREYDAKAAVRAGLDILRAFQQRALNRKGERLSARIGIHSGVVLASEMGFGANRQPLVVGEVPNLAARIQAEAEPNTVVIGAATYRLVRDTFVCRRLGPRLLRGAERPMSLHVVSRRRDDEDSRSRRVTGLPLVGRVRELQVLLDSWRTAREGHGQIVLLAGEAGVGKSRLLRELKAELRREVFAKIELHGVPHGESSAFFSVLEFVRRAWHLDRSASLDELKGKVRRGLGAAGDRPEVVDLMMELLDIVPPDVGPATANTPRRQKELTLELLAGLLFDSASARPTLLVVEDIQWVDPSTQELLQIVSKRIRKARVLMALLSRSALMPSWVVGVPVALVNVARLGHGDTAAMIRQMSGSTTLSSELTHDLIERCDGIPLYVEEVTRMVLDAGPAMEESLRQGQALSLADLGIPPTLQESLVARLDQLGAARDLAQLGSALGRSFDVKLATEVAGIDEQTLRGMLAILEDREILRGIGPTPSEAYFFRHALIQDAAYASLVPSRRRQLHSRIAESLETRLSAGVAVRPELVAHHWTVAERADAAIPHLLVAGKRAFERSAYTEAVRHLQQGLRLLEGVADTDARLALELTLCLALGPVLVATRGYSNPEVEQVYARARALCPKTGGDRLLYAVLSGLHLFHQSRAELTICSELSQRRLALARELNEPTLEMHVMETAGTIAFWRGEHQAALGALDEALSRYEPDRDSVLRLMYGTDSRVVSEAYRAQALWYVGFPDQARAAGLRAIEHARAIVDIHSLALALVFGATVFLNRGDLEAAAGLAEEAVARSTEQRLEQWLGAALFVNGSIKARKGQAAEGLASMLEGAGIYQAVGAKVGARFFAARLGEAFQLAGRAADGLRALSTLSGMAGEDTCHDADLARVHGELSLAAGGDAATAASVFERGMLVARSQGARSLELRCSTALARVWRDTGRHDRARAVLGPVRGSVTEGHDTFDALAADDLLASLPM